MTGRRFRLAIALALVSILWAALAPPAQAAVSVSRAEVSGTRLRLEGRATPSRPISVDGVQMATSDSSGEFRIDRSGYTPPADCTVDVNDGSATPASVRLSGCTVVTPTPTPTPTPTASPTASPAPAPAATLDSIVLSPSTVQTGTLRTSATLYFTALTPAGGAVVSLSSSDTAIATVPATVTVPANSSTGAFEVTIRSAAAGVATIAATYNGVTRSAALTVTTQSLFRIITASQLPNARVGENYAGFIEACCGQGTPYRWSLVSGNVPDGLRFAGDDLRLSRTTAVTGTATRVQTTTFTVRARDGAGNTATKTFSLTVDPASPLVITNSSDQLPDGKVGVAYETGLFPSGGVPPWRWSHVGGTLPPGLFVQASPGRVKGTPTAAGSFTFTVRVDDSSGQFATRQFAITVVP